jgi:tetratricopeptide (TPR) repeat protein
MKIFLAVAFAAGCQSSFALDCSSPPSGFGGSWARAYASWCQQCGGTYNSSNQSCSPGPNWGGGRSTTPAPSYDYEAERQRQEAEHQRQIEEEQQRQRQLEEQRKREEETARKREEEFQRNKREALKSMKGISEGELGLKGSATGDLGLKDIGGTEPQGFGLKETRATSGKPKAGKMECEWGDQGPSLVDLRCLGLDPSKPITLDPHIARGEERAFPAQPDPETFKNANYNRGFEALMRFDTDSAAEAVKHFQQAQKERPKDPLVRNGLLLAQDILKARQEKEQNDRSQAAYLTLQGYAALMMGNNEKARGFLAQARKLAPKDNTATFAESLAKIDLGAEGAYPARRNAYRLVANGLTSIRHRNLPGALRMLKAAQRLQPEDKTIGVFVSELRKYERRQ